MSIVVDGRTYTLPAQANEIATLAPYKYALAFQAISASLTDRKWSGLVAQQRERLQGAGGLGVAAPNARTARWDSIKHIPAPFGKADGGEDEKEFGYWFNYFWNEAREAYDLNAAGQAQLCDAFFEALELDGAITRISPALRTYDNTQLQNILLKLMRVGFKRVQLTKQNGSLADVAVEAKTMFALNMARQGEKMRILHIGFRGDNRTPKELAGTGFKARARSKGLEVHRKFGMDQPWHPFNLPIYAESLFVRKGKSKDNCLHTVISVASNLKEIMPYPLVSDASLFKLASVEPSKWKPEDVQHVNSHWLRLKIVRDGKGEFDRITSDKTIYVLDMTKGMGFDTEGWQAKLGVSNPFPERAIDGVLEEQLLAVITLRKHYFYHRGEISLFDIELLKFEFLQNETAIRAALSFSAPEDIESLVKREIMSARNDYRLARTNYENSKLQGKALAGDALKCPVCGAKQRDAVALKAHIEIRHP